MSTEPQEPIDIQDSRRVGQWKRKIESITQVGSFAETAYKDSRLTLEEFNDDLFINGYKMVMRVVEREALNGDMKAADLLVKESKSWLSQQREKPADDDKSASSSPFVQVERKAKVEGTPKG